MKDEDAKRACRTVAEEKKSWNPTDIYTGRLIARVRRQMDILKIKTIRATLDTLNTSFTLEDKILRDCYARVVAIIDTEHCTAEVLDDVYAVYTVVTMLRERFPAMLPHIHRVSTVCMELGKTMGLAPRELTVVGALGVLHDVGKLGVSDAVISKQSPLTAMDWEDIKRHAAIGYALIRPIGGISELADLILSHHERWDGKGYPQGLKGEEIPLFSRILTLADSVDAMISERFYRKALSPPQVVAEIASCSGSQFDPTVVEAFFDMIREDRHALSFLSPLRDAVMGV
jgi:HD-GYP domain-containing protein (c-di-GMP phosphodiesterase class II)